jgi:CRP-like cAMP-binding protein/membrane protease YdiL (CAAX protease family)
MLSKFKLLSKMNPSQVAQIESLCEIVNYNVGDFLFHENEQQDTIYFIVSGILGLYKNSADSQEILKFKEIPSGHTVGEMAFVDRSPRSCSVKAETKVVAYLLSRQRIIDSVPHHAEILNAISIASNRIVNDHLRLLSDEYAMSLEKQIEELKERNLLGYFFLMMLFGLFLAAIFDEFLETFFPDQSIASTPLFSWIYLLGVGVLPFCLLVLKIDFPVKYVLDIRREAKQSLMDGIIFSSLGISLFIGACVFLNPIFPDQDFLYRLLRIQLSFAAFFYLFHSYIQEFFRAIVQILLQRFMLDKNGYVSVFLVALIFSMVHASYGFEFMVVTFAASVIFGLVYRRTYNLLGVTLLHFTLGFIFINFGQ